MHGVYEAIEWTVQNRARVETIGSSLFTLVLTKLLDEGVELSETHLSQGFINACFRACCATQVGQVPPNVKYGANPRRFDEKKWRRENADVSLGAEEFQARLDSAFQQHTSDLRTTCILGKRRSVCWPRSVASHRVHSIASARMCNRHLHHDVVFHRTRPVLCRRLH